MRGDPEVVNVEDPGLESPRPAPWVPVARIVAWVAVPLVSAGWVATTSDRYYPVFDEWATVSRGLSGSWLAGMFLGFNGHMWTVDNIAYSIQTNLFGLEDNWFIPLLLVLSLVATQVSVAAVLTRLAVPLPIALAAATVVTYFGPGSETMVSQHLFGANLALAASFAAVFTALGKQRGRGRAAMVAGILVFALLCDSANAASGLVLAFAVMLCLWPLSLSWIALGPPVVAHAAFLVLDYSKVLVNEPCANCTPVRFGASLSHSLSFGWAVTVRAAGGLVAGGPTAGFVLLVVATGCVAFGIAAHRLPRDVMATFVGGIGATLLTVGMLAYSRTGFWSTFDEAIASLDQTATRYLQAPAVYMVVAFLPAIWWTIRVSGRLATVVVTCATTIALVAVFIANMDVMNRARDFYVDWGDGVKIELRQVVRVLDEGCGPGAKVDAAAQPVSLSFQISVALVEELMDRRALTPDFGIPASDAIRAKICRTTP